MSLNQVSVTVSHHYSSITLRAASRWWIGQRWLILAIVAVGQIFIIFQKSAIWKKNLRLIWSELMERVTLDTAGAKALFCSEIQTSLGGFYTIISAFARLSQSFYTSRLWCRCTWSPLGNQCMQSIHSQATVCVVYLLQVQYMNPRMSNTKSPKIDTFGELIHFGACFKCLERTSQLYFHIW